eukprot:s463_g28.t1
MSSFLDREDMLILLTQLSLKNEANYCYCNATMLCLWWSILSRTTYQYGDCSASQDVMQTFFGQMLGPALSVRDFFHTLFNLWDHGTFPADAAEFAYYVLRWMGTPCISHKWSRLYMVENVSRQHDLGDEFSPIFLQEYMTEALSASVPQPDMNLPADDSMAGLMRLMQQAHDQYTSAL